MDRCSYFIKDKAMFGSFPTQEAVDELEKEGVRYFVDLTYSTEKKIVPYVTNYSYINYPIHDQGVPSNWNTFSHFIIKVINIIKNLKPEERLYLHCKGGHGRGGTVTAVILCQLFSMTPHEALEYTTKYHNNRRVMKDKWRKLGSPQTYTQKQFVCKFFEPLRIYQSTKNLSCFSNFSNHAVHIEGIGTFPTAEAAFQAHKYIDNKQYVNEQLNSISPYHSKSIGEQIINTDWENIKYNIMFKIIKLKIEQNKGVLDKLLISGLKPILYYIKDDDYWGVGNDSTGSNIIGNILMEIRLIYYENNIN
jgi:ribA/ribD-fused uncharacterized protein